MADAENAAEVVEVETTDDLRSSLTEAFGDSIGDDDAKFDVNASPDPVEVEAKPEEAKPDETPVAKADDKTPETEKPEEKIEPTVGEPSEEEKAATANDNGTDAVASPPPGWSIEAKSEFDKLPASVRSAISQRETEIDQGFAKLQEYRGLDSYVDMAKQNGKTLPDVVQAYMNAENVLATDFVGGIKGLCQHYGMSPSQLAAQLGGQVDPNAEPQQPDLLSPVMERINSLEGMIQGQANQQAQAVQQQNENQISEFFADPANKYAENVAPEMANLIKSGQATDLKSAYDQALWLNPQTRALLINERATSDADPAQAQAVQQAKTASQSITGAPAPDQPDTEALPPADDLIGELRQQFNAQNRL